MTWRGNVRRAVRRVVPASVVTGYRRAQERGRRALFALGMRRLTRQRLGSEPSKLTVWLLWRGWGNRGFAAGRDYLHSVLAEIAAVAPRRVLECGSGLTTVLMGVLAERGEFVVVSLEHDDEWRDAVARVLERYHVETVELPATRLVDHGSFHWYDTEAVRLTEPIDLVVCDGPPSRTPGGRYGLIPVMEEALGDAVILLDDAKREVEQDTLRRWSAEFGVEVELREGHERGLAIVRRGDAAPGA